VGIATALRVAAVMVPTVEHSCQVGQRPPRSPPGGGRKPRLACRYRRCFPKYAEAGQAGLPGHDASYRSRSRLPAPAGHDAGIQRQFPWHDVASGVAEQRRDGRDCLRGRANTVPRVTIGRKRRGIGARVARVDDNQAHPITRPRRRRIEREVRGDPDTNRDSHRRRAQVPCPAAKPCTGSPGRAGCAERQVERRRLAGRQHQKQGCNVADWQS